jgi:hypothetical protein
MTRNRIVARAQVMGHRQIPAIQQVPAITNRAPRRSTPELTASVCSNSPRSGRDRNRLNQAMRGHAMACDTKSWMPAAPADSASHPASEVNRNAVLAVVAVAQFMVSADG